ncbi:MAG: sigma-E processing peptidase SpoIIGA [Clostridia bacterium]|nr:sigma-E processing peptidase SpoIIGA [Clostridia bacterium]
MHTIYVDSLLCVNLFIDYIILYSLKKMLKINSKVIRLIPASALAALSTLGVFLPFYTRLFSVFYRIITGALIVFTAYGKTKFRNLFLRLSAYMGISICLAGFMLLIWMIFKPQGIIIYNDTIYFDISPVMLIVCTILAFISLSVYERIKEKINPDIKVHKVTVYTDNSKHSFNSMVDTGCNLKEPFSGLPVIVAESELLEKTKIPDEKLRLVPYSTLSGEGMLKAFKPQKILIDGKELKSGCYIGISEGNIKSEIKSLMGKEVSEGL